MRWVVWVGVGMMVGVGAALCVGVAWGQAGAVPSV